MEKIWLSALRAGACVDRYGMYVVRMVATLCFVAVLIAIYRRSPTERSRAVKLQVPVVSMGFVRRRFPHWDELRCTISPLRYFLRHSDGSGGSQGSKSMADLDDSTEVQVQDAAVYTCSHSRCRHRRLTACIGPTMYFTGDKRHRWRAHSLLLSLPMVLRWLDSESGE
jgi:hypothetical protein